MMLLMHFKNKAMCLYFYDVLGRSFKHSEILSDYRVRLCQSQSQKTILNNIWLKNLFIFGIKLYHLRSYNFKGATFDATPMFKTK